MNSSSSATTSSRVGSSGEPMISRSAHGLPCAPRPTITAAAPVVAGTACARPRDVMSPDAMTGTSTSSTSSAVSAWSASPVYIWRAERGCKVSVAAPASTSRGPTARQALEPFSRPRRIFTETGTSTADATAPTIAHARSGSFSRAPLATKGLHADPGHGGQDEAGGDLDVPDPPRFPEIYLHRAGNGIRRGY